MRSPLARVKGLGPARHGAERWWAHRVTAVSNIPLIISLVIIVASLKGARYPEAVGIVSHPLVAVILVLAVVSIVTHMRIGMQIIIEDYVHDKGWKIVALVTNHFYAVVTAVACLWAILKVSFGRI
jgi:succinate dehydrogenase / fumarate reductase membrane anchor subunit